MSPSLAGTRQFTSHERHEDLGRVPTPMLTPVPRRSIASAGRAAGTRGRTRRTRPAAAACSRSAMLRGDALEVDLHGTAARRSTAGCSGIAIDRIVRGWRSRAPERDLVLGEPRRLASGGRRSRSPDALDVGGTGRRAWRRRAAVVVGGSGSRAAHSCGGTRAVGGGRDHAPVAPGAVDQLGDRGQGPHDIGGPAGHQLHIGQGCEQSFRGGRVHVDGGVGDADLERRCARRDTAMPGRPELARERRGPLVAAPADDPRVVRLDPVDELRPSPPAAGP